MVNVNGRAEDHSPVDFVHTGPGTQAGRYMRRFWHPVYVADDLETGRAVPIRIMGENFALYRGESGMPHVVGFRCAHRGTELSSGWVEGDCIRCLYHGWKYDGSGQCVEQPAEERSFAEKIRIPSYPTIEYLGLIFAFLGEGEAPPLPQYPELEGEGILDVGSYTRFCNYFNSLENGIDEVHVTFAHSRSSFTEYGLNWNVPKIDAEETEYGIVQYGTRSNGAVRVTCFVMPNILFIKGSPNESESGWRDAFAWRVPIDDESHKSFNVRLVHVTGEKARQYREKRNHERAILEKLPSANHVADAIRGGRVKIGDIDERPDVVNIQDHVIQEGQGVIADRLNEHLGRSDVAIILLRKIWMRELSALSEGRPLKTWNRTRKLHTTTGL